MAATDHGKLTNPGEVSVTEKTCRRCKRRLPLSKFIQRRSGRKLARCEDCRYEWAKVNLGYDPRDRAARDAEQARLEKEDGEEDAWYENFRKMEAEGRGNEAVVELLRVNNEAQAEQVADHDKRERALEEFDKMEKKPQWPAPVRTAEEGED